MLVVCFYATRHVRLNFEQELERRMSYRDILLLRKDARGWRLEDMGEEPAAEASPPLDPEMMEGISEEDPQVL